MAPVKDTEEDQDTSIENADESNHGPQFEPIVSLPEQEILKQELFKMGNDLPEWKKRATADVKLLKHKEKGTTHLLMRRDKTRKICANRCITPMVELKPNVVWNDECPKPELLAIRFLNAENAQKFKTRFEEYRPKNDHYEKVAEKLEALSVKEETKEDAEEKQ
uniref:Ran-specific GTPase-activating protein n=1 Tax=Rhinopithecus roxellana TaxID=61622 RepID=A0A2K6RLB0_RHIRO